MGDLMIKHDELILLTNNKGIGEVIKPLVKEIHLFDTYIAGTTHLADKSVLEEVVVGNKLTLQRENNKFDEKAILLFAENGKKIGYVPEKDNIIFSRLMDAGKLLSAKITEIKERSQNFKQISISIYLVDF
ncbi:MAG: HIRAN domain-containing protein [Clostridia bacterium]|nr:HIRAN domain-containing protein [Clostridia bacterium]